jgi:hypothetical protein
MQEDYEIIVIASLFIITDFLLFCSQNAGNSVSKPSKIKHFLGEHSPTIQLGKSKILVTGLSIQLIQKGFPLKNLKVTGHPFWRFAENRYCALNISAILLIKFSPNVRQCMQNMVKL